MSESPSLLTDSSRAVICIECHDEGRRQIVRQRGGAWICPKHRDLCHIRLEEPTHGPIGPGTPHARMEATWERMSEDQADVMRLTDYHPMKAFTPIEWCYVDAFRALKAERDELLRLLANATDPENSGDWEEAREVGWAYAQEIGGEDV